MNTNAFDELNSLSRPIYTSPYLIEGSDEEEDEDKKKVLPLWFRPALLSILAVVAIGGGLIGYKALLNSSRVEYAGGENVAIESSGVTSGDSETSLGDGTDSGLQALSLTPGLNTTAVLSSGSSGNSSINNPTGVTELNWCDTTQAALLNNSTSGFLSYLTSAEQSYILTTDWSTGPNGAEKSTYCSGSTAFPSGNKVSALSYSEWNILKYFYKDAFGAGHTTFGPDSVNSFWNRSSVSGTSNSLWTVLTASGNFNAEIATKTDVSLVPSFYVDPTTCSASGDGTAASPYVLTDKNCPTGPIFSNLTLGGISSGTIDRNLDTNSSVAIAGSISNGSGATTITLQFSSNYDSNSNLGYWTDVCTLSGVTAIPATIASLENPAGACTIDLADLNSGTYNLVVRACNSNGACSGAAPITGTTVGIGVNLSRTATFTPTVVTTGQYLDIGPVPAPSTALTFTGVALRRYQPITSATIDNTSPATYFNQVEIGPVATCTVGTSDADCKNEWAIPTYNSTGTNMTTGTDNQSYFRLHNKASISSDIVTRFYLDRTSTISSGYSNNLRADESIFRLEADFLYRTPNNVEWRSVAAQELYYQIVLDTNGPVEQITVDGTETYSGNYNYNDTGLSFVLRAKEESSSPSPTGLKSWRSAWYTRAAYDVAPNCTTIMNNNSVAQDYDLGVIQPDNFYQLGTTSSPVSLPANVGPYVLCLEATDIAGNATWVAGFYNFNIPSTIAMTCTSAVGGSSTLTMNTLSGGAGSYSSLGTANPYSGNLIKCTLNTNALSGYDLSMKAVNSANLTTSTSGYSSYYFSPLAVGSPSSPANWAVANNVSSWGVRVHSLSPSYGTTDQSVTNIPTIWGSNTSNPYTGGKWTGLTTTAQNIYLRRGADTSRYNSGQGSTLIDNVYFQVGAQIGSNYMMPALAYSGQVQITATAVNPPTTNTMQGMTTAICDAMPTCDTGDDCDHNGSTLTLTDIRDSKTYRVRKFADGNCWMIDNLRYGGSTTDGCSGKSTFDGGRTSTGVGRSVSGTWTGAVGTSAESFYGSCMDPKGMTCSNPTDGCSSTYCSTHDCGYYYSWQAAIQNSLAYYGNAYQPTEPVTGICPTGWQLPAGTGDNSFQALHSAMGYTTTGPVTVTDGRQYWNCGTGCTGFWQSTPWAGLFSGHAYYNGAIYNQGLHGDWWSSSQYSSVYSYYLGFYSGWVNPPYSYNKFYGFSVRCLF